MRTLPVCWIPGMVQSVSVYSHTLFRFSFNTVCYLLAPAGGPLLHGLRVCVQPPSPHLQDVRHESRERQTHHPILPPLHVGVKYGHLLGDGRADVRRKKERAKGKVRWDNRSRQHWARGALVKPRIPRDKGFLAASQTHDACNCCLQLLQSLLNAALSKLPWSTFRSVLLNEESGSGRADVNLHVFL